MVPWAKVHDLAMVEGDQCFEQEVQVAAGHPLVEMHVTIWAEAQREDLMLSIVLDWLCCHPEWVSLRCRSSRVWPYPVLAAGTFLVAGNDRPSTEIPHVQLTLPAAWRQVVYGAPTPNCVHCSDGSPTMWTLLVLRWPWSQTDHPRSQTSWCSRTISQSTLWHMWPPTRLQKQLPSFCIRVTSRSLEPWTGS